MKLRVSVLVAAAIISVNCCRAGVGDPQVATDHPWYGGELTCSTFDRLFETQAALYKRVVGRRPASDQDKALAAWLWRNAHYYHGEEGAEDLWGRGLNRGPDVRNREYWGGLFAHGFGLCGTTHSQWVAEMEALLGHGRGRGAGVSGHNSFEVFLTGGPYGPGKWVLLDHDISTVIFNRDGNALLSIREIVPDWKRLTDRANEPSRQHGWLVCGLHSGDGGVYQSFGVAEYLAGYAGPPPMVHLRRGETLRRYLRPGLADGKTFVFWGRNYYTGVIPGPERAETWVNQPEKMHGSRDGTGHHPGQARYGNAVYTYRPDFASGDYREGVVGEDASQVTFEFASPYVIAATPPNDKPWGIYEAGARNGLVLRGKASCTVSLSIDAGKSWQDCGRFADGLDLTDRVKGRRQYLLRLHAGAKELIGSEMTITTVCQANAVVLPWLQDGGTNVRFAASARALESAGPNLTHAETHLVDGKFGTPQVTLELATPRGEPALTLYAAAHVNSSNPPDPKIKYQIEYSSDRGRSWNPVVKDWTIPRRGDEPPDFWSQSLCWGEVKLDGGPKSIRVRFRNDGGKSYARAEAHLAYQVKGNDATRVTFQWRDDGGEHEASRDFTADGTWSLATGRGVRTDWVELAPLNPR
jgi:hypothetical protein